MNTLGSIYGLMAGARNSLFDRGLLAARRLEGAVVSVGNLAMGGAGKTPFVLLLGGLLKERGVAFDILSRGYGRKTSGVAEVDPKGTAALFGDEPLLLARRLGVPVIVGESRHAAGQYAERKFGAQLHLLDDGFQHRSLARDFDIVLITPEDLNDRLLPGGRLREPLSALSRADAVVLGGDVTADRLAGLGKAVWRVQRGIEVAAVPERPVAFCGIARPGNFFSQLRASGIDPVAESAYRDHHAYVENDVRLLLELREEKRGGGFITTEKDAINLGGFAAQLQPLAIVKVTMEWENAANAVDTMLRTIEERRRQA